MMRTGQTDLDRYFGREQQSYRQVHADVGVETALYLDDLWQLYKRDPAYEKEWQQVTQFYFRHAPVHAPTAEEITEGV